MTTEQAEAAKRAREMEAQLAEYPDERGEILSEAAECWRRAGDAERAIALLTEAVGLGGEDGGTARVELADLLFDLGRADEARAQLDTLRGERPPSPAPYHLAAELMESRGAHGEALTWFNLAVSRLSEEELADREGEFGVLSYANNILAGRRRVRQALGFPADELDSSVAEFDPGVFNANHAHTAHTAHPGTAQTVRVLFWPREEIPRAHERWPRLVQHVDVEEILADREAANREMSDSGVAQITMVPLTTAKLVEFAARTGGDPVDAHVRRACSDEVVREGGTIAWPPPRNAACWCGSGVKYKKCCGRPAST